MCRFLLILVMLLFFAVPGIRAQKRIIVVDSLSRLPVKDAYLCSKKDGATKIIAVSDDNGEILISEKSAISDSLFFSHISYYPLHFVLSGNSVQTLGILSKESTLADVSISSLITHNIKTIGYYHQKAKEYLCAANPGWVLGCIIDVDTSIKKFIISKLFCEFENIGLVQTRKSNCKIGVIFHFFAVNDGKPETYEIMDPVVFNFADIRKNFQKEVLSIPITNTSGQIFVGVEWQMLPCAETTAYIKRFDLPIKYDPLNNKVWTLDTRSGRWLKSKGALTDGRPGISLEIKY